MNRVFLAAGFVLALAGCPGEDPFGDDDDEPMSVLVASWGDVPASVERVVDGARSFVSSLPGHALLVGDGVELHRIDPLLPLPLVLDDESVVVTAIAPLDDVSAAVATESGLFIIEGDSMRASPLNELLGDEPITAMLAAPFGDGVDLWMATASSLRLHRDGRLHEVAVGELQTADATLVWGPTVDGSPSLWVAAGDDFYSITAVGNGLSALPVLGGPGRVDHIVSDAAGRLWVSGADGFFRRGGDETWVELVSQAPVQALLGRPDDTDVYIVTDQLLHAQGDGFYALTGVPEGELVGLDPLGRLLVLGAEGVDRVSADRPLGWLGLGAGDQLDDIVSLRLLPTLPELVSDVSATLNGGDASLDESWSLLVDPLELADGPQTLEFTVTYEDADPTSAELFFSVGEFVPPTWSADIEPLFDRECAECHTDAGVSRPLDTPASWEAELDLILYNLDEARMPLPPRDPLTLSEIQLVRAWAAGGFPE